MCCYSSLGNEVMLLFLQASCRSKHEVPDLATGAGVMRGGPSRFAPIRTPARTPATLRRFLATPMGARRSPARTPGTALSVGRGGLDSWLRRMGLAEVVWPMCPSFLVYSHRT